MADEQNQTGSTGLGTQGASTEGQQTQGEGQQQDSTQSNPPKTDGMRFGRSQSSQSGNQ